MKPARIVLLAFALILTSCNLNTGGTVGGTNGNTVGTSAGNNGELLPLPLTGLDKLTHYKASLTVSTQEQTSSGSVDRNEQYSLSVWPAEDAIFEMIDSFDDANQPLKVTLGKVDQAGYFLWNGDSGCQVTWASENIKIDATDLSPFLYELESGTPAGDESVAGIETHAYQINFDSVGVQGIQADGEIWLAASGGFLVKYHLVLTGDQALFGSDGKGSRTIDYELSEINNGTPVTYPGDCLPVLTDIPASDDAQGIQRMPDDLSYISASTSDQLQAFYEKYFSSQGWVEESENDLATGEKDFLFTQKSTGRTADVFLKTQGSTISVEVQNVEAQTPQNASTTGVPATSTPGGETNQDPSVRIASAMGKLIGSSKTLSVFPSYSMSMNESIPSASGSDVTTLQVDAQGANYQFVLSSGGTQTDAIHFNGQDYTVVNGKAQPGSAMLAVNWAMWQLDPAVIFGAAAASDLTAQAGTTLEGRQVDVYKVDSSSLGSPLPDLSMGMLPYVITAIQGTVWIDHATGGLLKADLQFEADVKKSGETTPSAHGKGELHITVSQIGKVTVSLP
jgi:hypothetical protein